MFVSSFYIHTNIRTVTKPSSTLSKLKYNAVEREREEQIDVRAVLTLLYWMISPSQRTDGHSLSMISPSLADGRGNMSLFALA